MKQNEKTRVPLNLFLYLSCFSLGWGWLSGNWFGIPAEYLPGFMRGWSFLSDPQTNPLAQELAVKTGLLKEGMTESQINGMWNDFNNRIVQWLCFFLAAIHLTSARLFKFAVDFKSDWRAWGNLGWALLLIANFLTAVNLIVFPGTFPAAFGYSAYILGGILTAVTTKPQDLLNFPFSLIGSFTDILSYIRLFAVGLAGTCIAVNFNNMGAMLLDGRSGISYFLALLAMILIVLFGHILNIALSFLSVLAHGVRLNTLEFSSHVGMQWSGTKYKPFAKFKENNKLENNNKEIEK
jgi:V/A-type H+-transporting ATPase subunit I